jgi:hypothetical protein
MTKAAPRLRELQRWFASVATHPQGLLEGQRLERLLTPGPQLSARERLQIYNDGYFARLLECLADDYPAVRYALGEDDFAQLARAYIAQFPSRSPSLNAYGKPMAAFCRTLSQPWADFAADLARLEWALVEIVHEPISTGLTSETLAALPPSRWQAARLVPSRCLRVLSFDYPVNHFFQAFRDEQSPDVPARAASSTAVYRQGQALWRMDLDPRAALLLEDLVAGAPLAAAVAALEGRSRAAGDELAQLLPQWLGSWVQSGFFRGIG